MSRILTLPLPPNFRRVWAIRLICNRSPSNTRILVIHIAIMFAFSSFTQHFLTIFPKYAALVTSNLSVITFTLVRAMHLYMVPEPAAAGQCM